MIGLVALGVMLVAYQVYALTLEPWIDPPLARQDYEVTDAELAAGKQGVSRYQAVLASYFPAGHWSLTRPPIVVESGQVMLVLSKYNRNDNGSIDIDACAVVMFPTPRVVGQQPPLDAVVLEAPGGAHLQFDDDFDPARGKMGRIVQGIFPGVITISSQMKDPGPDDDLFIETHDLTMNEAVIKTLAEVKLQYGKSNGGGRHLEIGLARDEDVRQGMNLIGVKSLEIRENVALRLQLDGLSVTGDQDRVAVSSFGTIQTVAYRNAVASTSPIISPVTVTCAGSFHFDFLDNEAIFERKVELRQQRIDGPFDALDCNQLSLHFAALDERGLPLPEEPVRSGKQQDKFKNLQPFMIEAVGSVRLDSPQQQLAARADRMGINLPLRELTLDLGHEIALKHGKSELRVASYGPNNSRTPRITYRHPPSDVPQSIGDLTVVGPGVLTMRDEKTARDLTLRWQQVDGGENAVVMRRLDGQPVLTITGAPEFDAGGLGRLNADRVQLFLREVVPDGPEGPAIELENKSHKLAIVPDRIAASGRVEVNSPQLTGTTRQLQAWFRQQAITPSESVGVIPISQGSGGSEGPTRTSTHRFDFESEQVSVDIALSGRKAEATGVTCQGGVVLRETAGMKSGDEPLRVEGQALRVEQLSTQPTITVRGTPAAPNTEAGLASIAARGLTLYAGQVNADAEKSRFWIEGAGKARLMVDGGVIGETRGTKVPVHLSWRGGLSVDGTRIVCSGDIFAESEHSWMQCDRIVANLTRPIYPSPSGNEKIELAGLSLLGNIVVDYRSVDERGQRSHDRVQIRSLTYDHATGDITGSGPGAIRSAHLSSAATGLTAASPNPNESAARLRFLRLDFQEGISGNANQRVLRFHRRVRGIYGPIDGWQQELFANDPKGLPPDVVVVSAELLQLNEDPTAPRGPLAGNQQIGPLEAVAEGNVQIEGSGKDESRFSASAPRASFSQTKDTFILEGTRESPARIRRFDSSNGDSGVTEAEQIEYDRTGPRVRFKKFRQFEVQPGQR